MTQGFNRFIATAAGIGYLPFAPGTWASIFAILLWYLLGHLTGDHYAWQIVFVLAVIIVGIYSSNKIIGAEQKDPSHVVIDEVAGMWVTLLLIPFSYQNFLAGFVLFRFFDIAKPFGIKRLENYRSGYGVMFDDLLAGIYSNIILHIIVYSKVW